MCVFVSRHVKELLSGTGETTTRFYWVQIWWSWRNDVGYGVRFSRGNTCGQSESAIQLIMSFRGIPNWCPINAGIPHQGTEEASDSDLCFSVVNGAGPEYLSELLTIYTPSRQLRSTSDTRLSRSPSLKTKTNGQRSFSFQAATVWNNLLQTVRYSTPISSLKSSL